MLSPPLFDDGAAREMRKKPLVPSPYRDSRATRTPRFPGVGKVPARETRLRRAVVGNNAGMQRLFHYAAGGDRLVARSIEELASARREGGWIWLDVTGPTPDELWEIAAAFGLDALSIEDVLDVELLPKLDQHPDYLFLVLHGVVTGLGRRLDTAELDVFIGSDFVVSVHADHLAGVESLVDHLDDGHPVASTTPAALAAAIAGAGMRRLLPLLDHLDERIEALEESAVQADPATLRESHALRRDVIMLRRTLGPQREVTLRLSQPGSDLVDVPARRAFSDVYDHQFRMVESLDSARSLLASVVETYRGAVAERTNEVMKVLTVFSAVMLPLTLVAGIWGMNFVEIPAARMRWGFFGMVAAMAIFGVSLWAYFVRRGFIGGSRLKDVPKAIGLGLIHVGTAPVRVVATSVKKRDHVPPESDAEEPA